MTYDYYGCHCKVVEMRKRFGLQIMQSLYKMMLYHLLLHQGKNCICTVRYTPVDYIDLNSLDD